MYEIQVRSKATDRGVFATRDIASGTLIMSETPLLRSSSTTFLQNYNSLDAVSMHKFHSLYPSDDSEPFDIWRANCFGVPYDDEAAVFKQACLINHSCNPNAKCTWSPHSGTLEVTALKYIKRGEETFHSYLSNGEGTVDERRWMLGVWGFVCWCEKCTEEDAELY